MRIRTCNITTCNTEFAEKHILVINFSDTGGDRNNFNYVSLHLRRQISVPLCLQTLTFLLFIGCISNLFTESLRHTTELFCSTLNNRIFMIVDIQIFLLSTYSNITFYFHEGNSSHLSKWHNSKVSSIIHKLVFWCHFLFLNVKWTCFLQF